MVWLWSGCGVPGVVPVVVCCGVVMAIPQPQTPHYFSRSDIAVWLWCVRGVRAVSVWCSWSSADERWHLCADMLPGTRSSTASSATSSAPGSRSSSRPPAAAAAAAAVGRATTAGCGTGWDAAREDAAAAVGDDKVSRSPSSNSRLWLRPRSRCIQVHVLFRSLAVLDPRVGHTVDVLSPFISVLCRSD